MGFADFLGTGQSVPDDVPQPGGERIEKNSENPSFSDKFSAALKNPALMQASLMAGLRLMQGANPGQSGGSYLADALQVGAGTFSAQRDADIKQTTKLREEDRAQQKIDDEKAWREGQLANSREQIASHDRYYKGSLELKDKELTETAAFHKLQIQKQIQANAIAAGQRADNQAYQLEMKTRQQDIGLLQSTQKEIETSLAKFNTYKASVLNKYADSGGVIPPEVQAAIEVAQSQLDLQLDALRSRANALGTKIYQDAWVPYAATPEIKIAPGTKTNAQATSEKETKNSPRVIGTQIQQRAIMEKGAPMTYAEFSAVYRKDGQEPPNEFQYNKMTEAAVGAEEIKGVPNRIDMVGMPGAETAIPKKKYVPPAGTVATGSIKK